MLVIGSKLGKERSRSKVKKLFSPGLSNLVLQLLPYLPAFLSSETISVLATFAWASRETEYMALLPSYLMLRTS